MYFMIIGTHYNYMAIYVEHYERCCRVAAFDVYTGYHIYHYQCTIFFGLYCTLYFDPLVMVPLHIASYFVGRFVHRQASSSIQGWAVFYVHPRGGCYT